MEQRIDQTTKRPTRPFSSTARRDNCWLAAEVWAAFEATYRENPNACEIALARGYLPNPEKSKDNATVEKALAEYAAGKIGIADLTMARFEPFAAGDKEGFEAFVGKLRVKYKALEKEDMKRRPLTALATA